MTRWGGRDWTTYYTAVAGKGPRETLLLALDALGWPGTPSRVAPDPPVAVDIGCGEGRDTRELLRRGFRVVASDPHPQAMPRTLGGLSAEELSRLTFHPLDAHQLSAAPPAGTPLRFAIVNASFSLPFVPPEEFDAVWAWVRGSIAPGGLFAGQLFGPRDTWATIPGRSHHSLPRVKELLAGLDLVFFDESEKDGQDAEGNAKHWHCFHIVARRPIEANPCEAGR